MKNKPYILLFLFSIIFIILAILSSLKNSITQTISMLIIAFGLALVGLSFYLTYKNSNKKSK